MLQTDGLTALYLQVTKYSKESTQLGLYCLECSKGTTEHQGFLNCRVQQRWIS